VFLSHSNLFLEKIHKMAMGGSLIVLALLILLGFSNFTSQKCIMFNMGDSNTDIGEMVAVAGVTLPRPYGERFNFNMLVTQHSDGRLYIDFLCKLSLFLGLV